MANKKYEHIDVDYIVDQYTTHTRTSVELAEELGVSDWWIRDRLKSKDIPIRRAGGGLTTIDLTGQRFGNYLVIEKIERPGITQSARWKVRCDCGNVNEVYSKALRLEQAMSCGICDGHSHKWRGIGDLSGSYFRSIINGAKNRSIEFDIQMEYIWDLFQEQEGRCNLSGLEISLIKKNTKKEKIERTASLDRIDSKLGYIEGNVQWVHKSVNLMKWHLDQEFFIQMCRNITNNQI